MRLVVLFSTIAFLVQFVSTAQPADVRQLEEALVKATHDTARISILGKLSKEENYKASGLKWARKAYLLSQNQNYPEYKAKGLEVLGTALRRPKPDSSLTLIHQAIQIYLENNHLTKAADAYHSLGRTLEEMGKNDSAYFYYNHQLHFSKELDYEKGIADGYYNMSAIDNKKGHNIEALRKAVLAKDHYQKAGSSSGMGDAHNQMGIIYDFMGLYSEALENYLQAKDIAEETKDIESQILIANNLGVIYDDMKKPDQALRYYNEAMELSGIYHNKPEDKALLLNNVSYIHLSSGDTAKALQSLWQSVQIIKDHNITCFDGYPMEGLIAIYIQKGQIDSARYYLDKSLKSATMCEDLSLLTSLYKDEGKLLSQTGQYKQAEISLKKSLDFSRSANLTMETQESLQELFKFYKNQGDQAKALDYLEQYTQFKDSVIALKADERAAQLAAEYEFRKHVEQMELERKESEFTLQSEIASKQREITIILIGLILVGVLAIILGRFYILIDGQNKKLKWLNEEKNTLMGVVAHDLRNPLNMIKGLMGLIEDTRDHLKAEDMTHYLNLIGSTTDRMSDMIERVLDISAIENMKVNLNMTKTDLTMTLQKASENFSQIAAQKKIRIENEFDLGQHEFAIVDSRYLDQILDNLISNAIKFSDRGKTIKLSVRTEDGHKLISIADQGPGISIEDQENMFRKFTKLQARPTNNERSTGLGLSIVQKFVSAMDGEIICDSVVNEGTTFSLKFKAA